MQATASTRYFSGSYAQARRKFLASAQQRQAEVESFVLESRRGAYGEVLTTDVAWRAAVTGGQYTVPDGLFYGGNAPSWSNRTIHAVLRKYCATASALRWSARTTGCTATRRRRRSSRRRSARACAMRSTATTTNGKAWCWARPGSPCCRRCSDSARPRTETIRTGLPRRGRTPTAAFP